MPENTMLYRTGLSAVGGLILGAFGLLAGALWALAVGADVVLVCLVVAALASLWGMVVVQLTPTGGVIMENKTTVNYAVIALHGWITFFICLVALVVWAIRALAF
jgi:hypothetical protein